MAKITPVPAGLPISISRACVTAVKSDFVKREVKITIVMALDDEALALRERLTYLALSPEDTPVSVDLQPLQMKLLD